MKFDAAVEEALAKIEGVLGNKVSSSTSRWYAIKLFEAEDKTIDDLKLPKADLNAIDAIRESIENKLDDDAESIVTSERYNAISHVIDKTVKRSRTGLTTSQKIDRVVTNRWLGLPIFIAIMFFVYWLAVSVGGGCDRLGQRRHLRRRLALHRRAALTKATGEYEDAHSQVVAYVTSILGEDEARAFRAMSPRKCLTRWPLEPELLKTMPMQTPWEYDAGAEYENA